MIIEEVKHFEESYYSFCCNEYQRDFEKKYEGKPNLILDFNDFRFNVKKRKSLFSNDF